jgi:hypothetical protein
MSKANRKCRYAAYMLAVNVYDERLLRHIASSLSRVSDVIMDREKRHDLPKGVRPKRRWQVASSMSKGE